MTSRYSLGLSALTQQVTLIPTDLSRIPLFLGSLFFFFSPSEKQNRTYTEVIAIVLLFNPLHVKADSPVRLTFIAHSHSQPFLNFISVSYVLCTAANR